MEANQANLGICSTCIYLDTCVRRASHNNPVWQCNEFEYETLKPEKEKLSIQKSDYPGKEKADDGKYLGLCKNCSQRKTCRYEKTPGGVWHCEDYS